MRKVKITFQDGRTSIIPEANLSNTMRLLEKKIVNVEAVEPEPQVLSEEMPTVYEEIEVTESKIFENETKTEEGNDPQFRAVIDDFFESVNEDIKKSEEAKASKPKPTKKPTKKPANKGGRPKKK